jgi:DnaJ-class molecular chaperone
VRGAARPAAPLLKRQGNDLLLEMPINVSQAALGDKFAAPTRDGKEVSVYQPRVVSLR